MDRDDRLICVVVFAYVSAALAFGLLQSLPAEGYVEGSASGPEGFLLTGEPGDELKLLLPGLQAGADYSEFAVRISDVDAGFEVLVPLVVGTDGEWGPVYGRLVVPEVPRGSGGVLTGTLSGPAMAADWRASVNVPLALRVVPRGTLARRGTRDMTWPRRVEAALFVMLIGPWVLLVLLPAHALLAALIPVAVRGLHRRRGPTAVAPGDATRPRGSPR